MNPVLEVTKISKTYKSGDETLQILNDVNFAMNQAEIIAVTGPSGIGKTTLLNIIGTLDTPDEGDVVIEGQNPLHLSDNELSTFRARKLGFIFQFHYLLPEFTALENVMIPARILSNNTDKIEKDASELLNAVGVYHRKTHKPSELSGGERQRVAVARALINRPVLVLADEPTGNLDPENGNKLIELIHGLRDEYKQSFLIATHSRSLAASCDRIIRLSS